MFTALQLPGFALQALLRQEPELARQPALLVATEHRQTVVRVANRLAEKAGVTPGMSLGEALARTPDAVTRGASRTAERSLTRLLFTLGYTLTPRLELTRPGLLTLEHGPSPEEPLLRALRPLSALFREEGLDVRTGLAQTPALAFLASLEATSRDAGVWMTDDSIAAGLRALPVAAAPELSPATLGILADWGILTLVDFAQLPPQDLTERLGAEARQLWEELHGQRTRVLQVARPPQHFEEVVELEYRLDSLEPLLFLVRRSLDSLVRQLGAVHRAARKVGLALTLEDQPPHTVELTLPEPTTRADLLFRVIQTKLENLQTRGALTGYVLRLQPTAVAERQLRLFGAAVRNPWQLADTLDRLAAMVGPEGVGSPRPVDTHRPDTFTLEALPPEVSEGEETAGPPVFGPPLCRYRPPMAAVVTLREGRPVAVQSAKFEDTILACRGPWRKRGDWWHHGYWAEENWDIERQTGGLYRLTKRGGRWFLDGEYD